MLRHMDCTMPDTCAGKCRHSRGSGAPRGGDPRQHPLPGGGQITLRFTDQPATDTVEVAANTRNLRTNGRWRDEFALGYCANRKLIARHLVVGAERDSQPQRPAVRCGGRGAGRAALQALPDTADRYRRDSIW